MNDEDGNASLQKRPQTYLYFTVILEQISGKVNFSGVPHLLTRPSEILIKLNGFGSSSKPVYSENICLVLIYNGRTASCACNMLLYRPVSEVVLIEVSLYEISII